MLKKNGSRPKKKKRASGQNIPASGKKMGVLDGFGCGLVAYKGRRFPTVGDTAKVGWILNYRSIRVAGSQSDRQPEGLG